MKGKLFLVALFFFLVFGGLCFPVLERGPEAATAAAGKYLQQVIEGAKREKQVIFGFALEDREADALFAPFLKRYPFLKLDYRSVSGLEERERILAETKAGVYEWDALYINPEIVPRFKEAGVLMGSVRWSELGIDKKFVAPDGFSVVVGGAAYGIAYNPKLVPAARVPKKWEDCLDPYWKGKMLVDVRPRPFAPLYLYWGEKRALDYARKLAANGPVWTRGQGPLTRLGAGEFAIFCGVYYNNAMTLKEKGGDVEFVFAAPVSARTWATIYVFKGAKHPNSALLLASFLATEGQKLMDAGHRGSPLFPGSELYKLVQGKEGKVAEWELFGTEPMIVKKIVEAYGFPKAIAK
ncbi:MAG: extracellular solute-binding protein [Deltaproteobacteria bacterium]|nr:extracellular solute-binding protein [Deltaproteobacteria bacterium]